MYKLIFTCIILLGLTPPTFADPAAAPNSLPVDNVSQLTNFNVIEFRRYPVAPGRRQDFAKYFEAWFPEAFEQLGSIAFGSFFERGNPDTFTWMRGFHTIRDRAIASAAFYYGPVWQEHRDTVNPLLPGEDDNVLLLQPLNADTAIPVYPTVDPVTESDASKGIVVAQIYSIKKGTLDDFDKSALEAFKSLQVSGVCPAGVLVTLDVPNNFPQLPFRTDGPFLVAFHIIKNESTLKGIFDPLLKHTEDVLTRTGLLRTPPETIIMDPTARSRMRWLPKCY